MAKKPTVKGLFQKTTDEAAPRGKRRPIGLYLRQPTQDAIEQIAEAEGLNMHSLLAYAVTYFVKQYQAGKVKIETESQPRPKLDL
jgi:hypothetical protein